MAVGFARDGIPLIVIAALVAAGMYALALNRRSWPLWLIAFALTIGALWIAYFFSEPRRLTPGADPVATASADGSLRTPSGPPTPRRRREPARMISLSRNESHVHIDRLPVSAR